MIVDVETYAMSVGNRLPRIVSLQWCDPGSEIGILLHDDARRFLESVLRSGETIVGHYVAFDLGCAMVNWPELTPLIIGAYESDRVRCTQRWAQLRDTALGLGLKREYSLAACCKRFGVAHADKESPWRLRFGELDGVSLSDWPADALEYALTDALSTKLLTDKLPADLPDVTAQSRWDLALTLSSAFGMLTDQPMVARWAAEKQAEKLRLETDLDAAGLIKWDAKKDDYQRDMLAIRSRVLDVMGDRAPRTRPSKLHPRGQIQTSADVCRDSGDPVLQGLAEFQAIDAALSREWSLLQSPIVHTRYDLAVSGRSTSSKPNLQNMNKRSGSRGCFRTRDGKVYVIADYSGLELCTLAQLCVAMGTGDLLASDLRNGIDAHRDMAASIAGLTYEAFTREHELYRDYRQMSKAANFGFPGGLGPEAFVSYAWGTWGVRVTIPEAKRLRNQWRRKRPDVVRYMATVDKWLGGSCLACNVPVAGCAVCPSCGADVACGILRHYGSGRIRGGCTYTQGCNTLFQGLGGDVTKHALWALTKAGFAVAVFVHDEYVIEVDKASAVEAAYEIKTILERVASAWLPAAPARVEPVLATRWVKDDPLYDSAGRLALIEVSV